MATSNTAIANMALSHIGVGKVIANLETEQSEEAAACRVFYDEALDATLRDFSWPFAKKYATLNLVASSPNDEYLYSYRYPSDCVAVRKILSGTRNDTRQSRIHYTVAYDSTGRLIFTDEQTAKAIYTVRVEDPALYPSDFTMALSYRLAALVSPRVTKGDPFKMKEGLMKLYAMEISRAMATSINEGQDEEEPNSEFIRTRE